MQVGFYNELLSFGCVADCGSRIAPDCSGLLRTAPDCSGMLLLSFGCVASPQPSPGPHSVTGCLLPTRRYNVWACDADAIFIADPRPMMRQPEWRDALIAAATDCIDVRLDGRYPMLNCDLNTGLVYMRANPTTIAFTARWRETIASAKEVRIRDQAAFNMLLKARRLRYLGGGRRLFAASNGPDDITLGVLPLSQFLNGHTYFVQVRDATCLRPPCELCPSSLRSASHLPLISPRRPHPRRMQHAHTLPDAKPPLSVHLTYQFAEGASFAYGKRQRLRQAGLWLVDDDTYFNGRYITASTASANLLPITSLDEKVGLGQLFFTPPPLHTTSPSRRVPFTPPAFHIASSSAPWPHKGSAAPLLSMRRDERSCTRRCTLRRRSTPT